MAATELHVTGAHRDIHTPWRWRCGLCEELLEPEVRSRPEHVCEACRITYLDPAADPTLAEHFEGETSWVQECFYPDDEDHDEGRCRDCRWVEEAPRGGRCTGWADELLGAMGAGALQIRSKGQCLKGSGHVGECVHPVVRILAAA